MTIKSYNTVFTTMNRARTVHDETVLAADRSFCLALADATEENIKRAMNDHNKISTKLREFLTARLELEQLKLNEQT